MSCEYCKAKKTILVEEEAIRDICWSRGGEHDATITYRLGVFIDKRCDTAYLRLTDLDDCSCIEGGEKIEIKFCPFCGEDFSKKGE